MEQKLLFDIPKICPACGFGGLLPQYVKQPWWAKLLHLPWSDDFMTVKCTQCDYAFAAVEKKPLTPA